MECYVKQNLYLKDAVQEIAEEKYLLIGETAAFAVAAKEGLFCVVILIEEHEIKMNQIDLSESHVVTNNIIYDDYNDCVVHSFKNCVSRDTFEDSKLNNNKNFKVSLLLDYKNNFIKDKNNTLGGEKIAKMFIDKDKRLNVFTENPIKEVKMEKIGDLPKETIYFGERDGLCSCQRILKDVNDEPERLTEEFFNEILYTKDHIMLVNVNNKLQPVKISKVFKLLPDGWYIDMCDNNSKKSMRRPRKYCILGEGK